MADIYKSIYSIRKDIERIRYPQGSQQNPARTCKDLAYAHPKLPDGWYWVDPNLGMANDAIYVYCRIGNGETCIYPDKTVRNLPPTPFEWSLGRKWFSQLKTGFKITYESIGAVQMTFMRMLSASAAQNVTFDCVNSVVWFDKAGSTYRKAMKLMGSNEMEFTATSPEHERPTAHEDGCETGSATSKSVLEVRSRKLHQLPLTDFMAGDYGGNAQKLGFDFGPICFS